MATPDEDIGKLNSALQRTLKLLGELQLESANDPLSKGKVESLNAVLGVYDRLIAKQKQFQAASASAGGFGQTASPGNSAEEVRLNNLIRQRERLARVTREFEQNKPGTVREQIKYFDADKDRASYSKAQALLRDMDRRISQTRANIAAMYNDLNRGPKQANVGGGNENQTRDGHIPPDYDFVSEAYNKAKGGKKNAAQEEAERRIQAAQALARSNVKYGEAIEQARLLGLRVEDLKRIEDRGGGVQELLFKRNDATTGGRNVNYKTYVGQTGKATPGLSSQFRSFGSDIVRDIGQFTKWSIAVAAVYTPLQKLGELMQIMVANESALADATIAANIPFERSNQIFDLVTVAAQASGEAITGVIDAYAQAFRAAGRYTDEGEKSQKATALLNDSLILSKLSSLDQAGAIDTLTAALLQADMELDNGQELLNKWVRVSQIANVDIATLAVGVAVLGDSAETAGLSIDQLNGLVAVLSEQSISGSKEAANTAKALIGAYQSDTAEKTLNKYGIALKNVSGEARGFLDIYGQLASLREQGILSEPDVSEIALALGGGGSRRAKDASALINSQERLNDLSRESDLVTGDSSLANDSLAKKLETVQTATTRSANAFQSLAQTLGDEGGLLDTLKLMLNITTALTGGIDDLFSLLGRSGPLLATVSASLFALSKIPQTRKDLFIQNLGGGAGLNFGASGRNDIAGIRQQGAGAFGRNALSDVLSLNKRGGSILGAGAVIGAGIQNLGAGRNEQAVGNVVGGIIGAAIGGALSGGIGIAAGAAIGSSAGDAFVTGLLTHSQDLADYFAGVLPKPGDAPAGEPGVPREQTTEELLKESYKAIGGGNELIGQLNAFETYVNSRIQAVVKSGGQGAEGGFATSQSAALDLLKTANPELYAALSAKYDATNAAQGIGTSQSENRQIQQERQKLQQLADEERQKQLGLLAQGKIKPTEYANISDNLGGFTSTGLQDVTAFGEAFKDISADINSTEDAYRALVEFTVYGTEEQRGKLNEYTNDIQKMQAEWENWIPGRKPLDLELSTGAVRYGSREALGEGIASRQREAAQFTNNSIIQSRLQRINLPSVVGSYTEPVASADNQKIIQEGLKIQQQYHEDVGASAEEIKHLVENIEAFSVLTEAAGGTFFETIEGLHQWAYDAAQKSLEALGEIATDDKGIGFQKYDVPLAQLEQLAAQSLQMGQGWQESYNYDFKPEDQIAIDNQGIVQPLHADFKILALLLEQLNEKAQKELDGQYNIPDGATFWVPLTAAYYRNKDTGGAGGMGSIDVKENTGATDQNTQALNNLSIAFQNMRDTNAGYWMGEKKDSPTNPRLNPGQQGVNQVFESTVAASAAGNPFNNILDRRAEEEVNDKSILEGKYGNDYMTPINGLIDMLRGIFTSPKGGFHGYENNTGLGGVGAKGGRSGSENVNPNPVSRLDLKLQANTTIQLDGRALASALTNYLASDLLRTDNAQGTITKRYVI